MIDRRSWRAAGRLKKDHPSCVRLRPVTPIRAAFPKTPKTLDVGRLYRKRGGERAEDTTHRGGNEEISACRSERSRYNSARGAAELSRAISNLVVRDQKGSCRTPSQGEGGKDRNIKRRIDQISEYSLKIGEDRIRRTYVLCNRLVQREGKAGAKDSYFPPNNNA